MEKSKGSKDRGARRGLPIPTVDIRILVTLPTEDWSQVAANSYRVTDTSVIAVLRTRELPTSSTVKYL
ncbi:hypothetical protein RRG08_016731 [Elysia crispata]|uniref:Uncharacterized protein n=1 Tax=Elysia crispata TaxID=231223 RepID=A0AAE0YQD6_9GAST|nr:hypothetical protein RRG08_016731 [Elysia crispata]